MLLGTKMQHSQMQALGVLENRAQWNLYITYNVYVGYVTWHLIIIEQELQTCVLQVSFVPFCFVILHPWCMQLRMFRVS